MPKVTVSKNMRIGGKLYRTGDAAPVSRAHARVLTATKLATSFVEPAPPMPITPATAPVARAQQAQTHEEAHHEPKEFPHTAQAAAAAEATPKATPKAGPAKSAGPKVDK